MEYWCAILLRCGGLGVIPTIGSCTGGGVDGCCVMFMLKMAASYFSATVCFYPSYGMGLDGYGFWRASVRLAAVCVTASSG